VAYPRYLRERVRAVRADQALTIDELSKRFALPRTTIYYWVRDLRIPSSGPGGGFTKAGQRKGVRTMTEKYRLLREQAYDLGRWEFSRLEQIPNFRDFVCMYIAEGYKRSRNKVSVGNSDPNVIRLCQPWIVEFARKKIAYSVQYHADQDVDDLCRFWGEVVGRPPGEIRLQRKSNSKGLAARTWRSLYGVLTVSVGDTCFRARLQGWIDRLQDSWLDSLAFGA
jgi:hypothetical protein